MKLSRFALFCVIFLGLCVAVGLVVVTTANMLRTIKAQDQGAAAIEFDPRNLTPEQRRAALYGFSDAITCVAAAFESLGASEEGTALLRNSIPLQDFDFTMEEIMRASRELRAIRSARR
jgi:zinc transporter ZupT